MYEFDDDVISALVKLDEEFPGSSDDEVMRMLKERLEKKEDRERRRKRRLFNSLLIFCCFGGCFVEFLIFIALMSRIFHIPFGLSKFIEAGMAAFPVCLIFVFSCWEKE